MMASSEKPRSHKPGEQSPQQNLIISSRRIERLVELESATRSETEKLNDEAAAKWLKERDEAYKIGNTVTGLSQLEE
jgi:hypothetical protein